MKIVRIIIILSLAAIFSCQKSEKDKDRNVIESNALVKLTEEQAETISLKFGSIDSVTIEQKVRTNGYVDVPPQGRASVTTFKAGYAREVLLLVGNKVRKGQKLASLEDPSYIKMQQDFLDLSGQLKYLRSEYERQQELFADKITAEKNLLRAESELRSAEAQWKGLGEELKMMGISTQAVSDGRIVSTIAIKAPIEGYITQVNCTVGKYIQASEEMFEIVNPEHLHMELNVFEQDVMKVKIGQAVVADIPSVGLKAVNGEVFLIGQTLDDHSRTVKIHAHFETDVNKVLPGMYLEAQIITSVFKVTALPQQAITREGDDYYAFIQASPGQFKKVRITIGRGNESWVEVLNSGDLVNHKVVLEGTEYLSLSGGD